MGKVFPCEANKDVSADMLCKEGKAYESEDTRLPRDATYEATRSKIPWISTRGLLAFQAHLFPSG